MAKKKAVFVDANQMMFDFESIENDLIESGELIAVDVEIDPHLQDIQKMLPKLYSTQHEDVMFAEKRFENGKGYMFTNGTGTGKTFVGLGIVMRFYAQDKRNILIVVPTETKAKDWIEDGFTIGLDITLIDGIKDNGHEISVTTYANFYQNNALNRKHWHLIVYDESHYLCQNQAGKQTVYQDKHKQLANVPSQARMKAQEIYRNLKPAYNGTSEYYSKLKEYDMLVQEKTEKIVNSTKVVFLSATPFAYHKSIEYVDGCLVDINEVLKEKDPEFLDYNQPVGFDDFMINHFGYRMKTKKLTIPEVGVDMNLMERNFFETMRENGVMSTRILKVEMDYSREFKMIQSDIGDFINSGMELFYNDDFRKKYKLLSELYGRKYNYLYVNQLLECIKAQEIGPRIQTHLDLGRKVVIFHSYNNATLEHPFHFKESLLLKDEIYKATRLQVEVSEFKKDYPQYYNLNLSSIKNTREAISTMFPEALEFNGTVSKKNRIQNLKDFNRKDSGRDIIIIQTKAGREGISLHDKVGDCQRALINLGLPTAPTEAIQIEGRTYRNGVKSNAVYEYITLHTNFEMIAFGTKIAQRSRTAENLAMGNLARDLETAFKEGYINADTEMPSTTQGVGGKENDRFVSTISEFDKAITYYYSKMKKTSKNKAQEGIDYFATPEPLGYKIMEWINPQPGESGLEPSAGHGAIARFFPGYTKNHFIEPSLKLYAELAINSTGESKKDTFEMHSGINKYEFIAMNPPFGKSGLTAMEHIQKALVRHSLKRDFRCMAIVPAGPAMTARISNFLKEESGEFFYIRSEVLLPACTFSRAGTGTMCKLIEFRLRPYNSFPETKIFDLTHIKKVEDFFKEIEHMKL